MNLKERARALKQDIPAVMLAMRRKETPLSAKVLAAVTVAYALSPIDLIPDFIPVLGYLDDVLILPALVWLTVRLIPPAVLAACREEWAASGREKVKKNWLYALPILLIWIIAAWLVIRCFL